MKWFWNMKNLLIFLFALLVVSGVLLYLQPSLNQIGFQRDNASQDTSSFSEYKKAIVKQILEERIDELPNNQIIYQRLETQADGATEPIEVEFTQIIDAAKSVQFKVGDSVVLGKIADSAEYVIVDRYRVNGLVLAVAIFVALAIAFGRKKGLFSLLGLAVTAIILVYFTAPQILSGKNPVLIAGISAGVIAISSMLIAHGFNYRTRLSIISTLISLLFAVGLSYLFVYSAQLFGLGQADAFTLETGFLGTINLQGLLLAGLIISMLGILDDVTTAQTATVDELSKADNKLSRRELFNSAMSVGREHIASLINTLILVYVGVSLPLFLLIVAATNQPIWVLLNSEFMAEEIVRALAGSSALIIAVPISTAIAALAFQNKQQN